MNTEKKKYKVNIFGDQYVLVSDQSQEHVMKVASTVDSLMRDVAQAANLSDGKRVAVLAALQVADRVATLEFDAQNKKERQEALVTLIEKEISSTCSS
jgi:cell division protein ZapA